MHFSLVVLIGGYLEDTRLDFNQVVCTFSDGDITVTV